MQPNCLQPRHSGLTSGVMVWRAISYDSRSTLAVIPNILTANLYISLVIQLVVLPFMNSIQRGAFQQDKTAVAMQRVLQSVEMLLANKTMRFVSN